MLSFLSLLCTETTEPFLLKATREARISVSVSEFLVKAIKTERQSQSQGRSSCCRDKEERGMKYWASRHIQSIVTQSNDDDEVEMIIFMFTE